jgi:hypothetical protein
MHFLRLADLDFIKRQAGEHSLSFEENLTGVVASVSSLCVLAGIYDSLSDLTQTNAVYFTPLVTNAISAIFEGIRKFVYEPYRKLVQRVNILEKSMQQFADKSYREFTKQRIGALERTMQESDEPALYDQIALELFRDEKVRVACECNEPNRVKGIKQGRIHIEPRTSQDEINLEYLETIIGRNPQLINSYSERSSAVSIIAGDHVMNLSKTEITPLEDGMRYRRLIRGSFGVTSAGFVPSGCEYDVVDVVLENRENS